MNMKVIFCLFVVKGCILSILVHCHLILSLLCTHMCDFNPRAHVGATHLVHMDNKTLHIQREVEMICELS